MPICFRLQLRSKWTEHNEACILWNLLGGAAQISPITLSQRDPQKIGASRCLAFSWCSYSFDCRALRRHNSVHISSLASSFPLCCQVRLKQPDVTDLARVTFWARGRGTNFRAHSGEVWTEKMLKKKIWRTLTLKPFILYKKFHVVYPLTAGVFLLDLKGALSLVSLTCSLVWDEMSAKKIIKFYPFPVRCLNDRPIWHESPQIEFWSILFYIKLKVQLWISFCQTCPTRQSIDCSQEGDMFIYELKRKTKGPLGIPEKIDSWQRPWRHVSL